MTPERAKEMARELFFRVWPDEQTDPLSPFVTRDIETIAKYLISIDQEARKEVEQILLSSLGHINNNHQRSYSWHEVQDALEAIRGGQGV